MPAQDWRQRYRFNLLRNLARAPLAEDFEAFRSASRESMNLHIANNETVDESPVRWLVDTKVHEGLASADANPIQARMR